MSNNRKFESGTINVKNLHFALMSKEDLADQEPIYELPKFLGNSVKITRSSKSDIVSAYGDGFVVEDAIGDTGGDISLQIHALPLDIVKDIWDVAVDKNGVVVHSSSDNSKPIALMFEADKNNGETRWMAIYKVTLKKPDFDVSTKTNSVSFQQPTLSGTYKPLQNYYDNGDGKKRNLTYSEYDSDLADFNQTIADAWYNGVYFPEKPVTPPAPAPPSGSPMKSK